MAAVALVATGARAQCAAGWVSGFAAPGVGGNTVRCVATLDGGDVVVGGSFTVAGGITVPRIARFSPSTGVWSALGTGTTSTSNIYAVAALPGGDFFAGGNFSQIGGTTAARIARYDAASGTFLPLGTGLTGGGQVQAILPLPGNEVIVGGTITQVAGINVQHIARYNSNTGVWSSMNSLFASSGDMVNALALAPDGTVIVGGIFLNGGGIGALRIARYNPTTGAWSALGSGLNGTVNAVVVLTNGDVIAGGTFTMAGTVPVSRIARFDPTTETWSALGLGVSGSGTPSVDSIVLRPGGDLIVGGTFTVAGGVSASRVARYDTSTGVWSAMGTGVNSDVNGLTLLPDGDVVVGGLFTTPSTRIARYTFGGAAPVLSDHPSSQNACASGVATFSVTASGTGPFTYQWRKDTVAINTTSNPSAATATLLIPSPHLSDAGSYDCVVSNACSGVTSDPAVLSVCPADLTCDGGVDINDLLAFLAAFESGSAPADLDNGTASGNPDGGIDINDLLFFLNHFGSGC